MEDIFPKPAPKLLGKLSESEVYWRDHYNWLLGSGYRLRPRYHPEWVPSWAGNDKPVYLSHEDGQMAMGAINHAICLKDNTQVALKLVQRSQFPEEVSIMSYFSTEPLASDARNHCIPLIEVLQVPDDADVSILVMPLGRDYDNPDFDTIGEAIDFIRQVLEGVQFLHEHRVAHKDFAVTNVLMDAREFYPTGFHPCDPDRTVDYSQGVTAKYTRTQKPPRYWVIDFGLSQHYSTSEMPPMEVPFTALRSSVPEFSNGGKLYNPFPTDVYNVGELILQEFLDGSPAFGERNGRHGFEFLRALVNDMMLRDPEKRPNMDEVVFRFNGLIKALPTSILKSRCIPKSRNPEEHESLLLAVLKGTPYWVRRLGHVLKGRSPIPTRNASR